MALRNYRDTGVAGADFGAGFQFEFFCQVCDRRWESEFVPHRLGRFAGLIESFSYFLGGDNAARATSNIADMRAGGAKDKAFTAAMKHAETLYTECRQCYKAVCADCYDDNAGACIRCSEQQRGNSSSGGHQQSGNAVAACPSCQAPSNGGRFCAECGFDMASTHKNCPGCGVMTARASRFCGDCGHAF